MNNTPINQPAPLASPKQLQLNFLVPTVHIDGENVFIANEGDIPAIHFFQVRSEDDQHVHADVVASVRFPSLEQLKTLQATIAEAITNHTQRET